MHHFLCSLSYQDFRLSFCHWVIMISVMMMSHKGYAIVGVIIRKFSKIFSFWGPITLPLHWWGWNLMRRSYCAKFHPHRCNMSPLQGENLKITLWVTILALCAARNAPDNKTYSHIIHINSIVLTIHWLWLNVGVNYMYNTPEQSTAIN